MNCKCKHEEVCKYAIKIRNEICQVFSGEENAEVLAWENISIFLQTHCTWRLPE